MEKEKIEFSEFLEIEKKLEITIGRVGSAERIPKSKKLLKLTVCFDINTSGEKTVVTNLGDRFEPEAFVGLYLPFITNLQPSVMMGVTSEAMIVVGELNGEIKLSNYPIGTKLL